MAQVELKSGGLLVYGRPCHHQARLLRQPVEQRVVLDGVQYQLRGVLSTGPPSALHHFLFLHSMLNFMLFVDGLCSSLSHNTDTTAGIPLLKDNRVEPKLS